MAKGFTENTLADLPEYIRKQKEVVLAVFQQSSQEMINIMQTPTGKGGRMRVDTGFLRSSLDVTLGAPSNRYLQKQDAWTYEWNESSVAFTLNNARLGDTVYGVYIAAYAAPREARDFFVRTAAQQWPQIVAKNVRLARSKMR